MFRFVDLSFFLLQEASSSLDSNKQAEWLKAKMEACLNGTSNSSLLTGEYKTCIYLLRNIRPLTQAYVGRVAQSV